MDYLELLNGVAKAVKVNRNYTDATDLNQPLVDCGLDSLDTTLLIVNICEIFGIPEEIGSKVFPKNFLDVVAAIEAHHTRMPRSVAEALESIS